MLSPASGLKDLYPVTLLNKMLSPVPVYNKVIIHKFACFRNFSQVFQQNCFYSLLKMTTQATWKTEKNRILALSLEEKRKLYKNSVYVKLDSVDPWCKYVVTNKGIEAKKPTVDDLCEFKNITLNTEKNIFLSEKISLFQGDITKLEVSLKFTLN